jgi:hypothetical protein
VSAKIDIRPDYVRNMRLIGHSDQGGRGDGVQLMVNRGFAYVGHMFSKGFSVIDVRDPANPKTVNYIEAPFNTWNIHLQAHDDLLLVINAKDMFAATVFQEEKAYYTGALGEKVGTAAGISDVQRDWTAGRCSIFPNPMRRIRSDSCRSMAAASIASGTPAAGGPTSLLFSTALPITSS